jgi:predicted metal-dependent hydrolase
VRDVFLWHALEESEHKAVAFDVLFDQRGNAEDDRAFATRLARYCARTPVALERLTYDRSAKAVTYRSDKSEGPTAGT